MVKLGLVGFPLGHSFSPGWFAGKFAEEGRKDIFYQLFPLKNISEFPLLINNEPELAGLNVTIPYKEKIIPYLDEIDETARKIGAVNTIKISRNAIGKVFTIGYNTDSPGFGLTLPDLPLNCKALILGTGGASKAVSYALEKAGIPYQRVSRSGKLSGDFSYEEIDQNLMSKYLMIINTTPLGMFPEVNTAPPLPYQFLTPDHYLYDLVYNPAETMFLRNGLSRGTRIINGLKMLENQATLSYQIFSGR